MELKNGKGERLLAKIRFLPLKEPFDLKVDIQSDFDNNLYIILTII